MIFEIEMPLTRVPVQKTNTYEGKYNLKTYFKKILSRHQIFLLVGRSDSATNNSNLWYGADLNLSWSVDFAHSTLYPCQSTVDHGKIPDEKKHELIPCTSETHERLSVPKSNVKKWWSQKSPKSSESSERSGHKAASISHYAVLRESRYYTSSPPPPPPPLLRVLPPTKWQIVGEG